jgi:peptidoglycan/LPS O-acetylase OafA/YrhL
MKWMRFSARLIIILWAAFWIFFVLASVVGVGEQDKAGIPVRERIKGFLAAGGIIFVCAGSVYLAWRRFLAAGLTLTSIGIVATVVSLSRPPGSFPVFLIMGLPPLVSGILFLLSAIEKKRSSRDI